MKLLYTKYLVEGRNLQYFINSVKKCGITLYSVKNMGNKSYFTIKSNDSEKFFAISKNLCYNIYKVKNGGLLYPVFLAYKNIGILIGIFVFLTLSFITDNMLFSIDITGSGKINESVVYESISKVGIKKYSFFSQTALDELEKELYSKSCFSFASVKKQGKILIIDVETAQSINKPTKLDNLTSTVSGVLESCKVYRGRQIKNIGDSVSVGDIIVAGELQINDSWQKTYVLATATILAEKEVTIVSEYGDRADFAISLAKDGLEEVVSSKVDCEAIDGKYVYTVKITYRVYILSR